MCLARFGGDRAPPVASRGGAVGAAGAIGGVEHLLGGVEVDRLEARETTVGEEGFEDVILGEWGRDDRLECFIRGDALGVSDRGRPPPLGVDGADMCNGPPLEAEERARREGDWVYCGYEVDLKSSGDRALTEEEADRGIISDDVVVDEDEEDVLMQGRVGFIAGSNWLLLW